MVDAKVEGRGNGRCKGRMAGRRIVWIIDERPSGDVGMDETWWDWLKGLVLWDSDRM